MQAQRQLTDPQAIGLIERGLDLTQELGAESALLVAQLDFACGVLHRLSDRRD